MGKLEDYSQLQTLMRDYLEELHLMCPAARVYTYEMFFQDFRICGAIAQICFADVLGGMLATLPSDHPNMALFRALLPRYAKTYEQLDIVGLTLDAARELGLQVTGPAPAPSAVVVSSAKELERAAFMQKHYPKNGLGDVTQEWMSALLGVEVVRMTHKVLDAGVTSDAAIFNLEFAGGQAQSASVPSSLVLKYAKEVESSRDLAKDAMMYEKEVLFYSALHGTVAKVMPIPDVIQVFKDPDNPDEFFCIAMEDLSVLFKPMDQTIGITWQQAKDLALSVGKLHATFWEHDVLKQPVVCGGDSTRAIVWFENWVTNTIAAGPEAFDKFWMGTKKPDRVGVDWCPTDPLKNLVRLWKAHGTALLEECHRILDSRPFTLVHGDLRSDNLFEGKDPSSGYKFIDWQTYGGSAPGVEMVQFLSGSISPTDDLEHMDEILGTYLDALHSTCAQSKSYTMAMLKEDYAIAFTMLYYGVADPFTPFFENLPSDHSLWANFRAFFPRYVKCASLLDIGSYNQRMADRLGLAVDPNIPFFGAPTTQEPPEAVPPSKSLKGSRMSIMSRSTDTQPTTQSGYLANPAGDRIVEEEDVAATTRRTFLQDKYPKQLSEVTKEWLSALVEQPLSAISVKKVLEAGVTSDAAIFGLEYAAGGTGPASVCVKYAKASESNRVFAQGGMMYEKEIMFYQELESMVSKGGMPIPDVIAVFVDPVKPKEFFCIVMNDMGAEHDAMDQIVGVSLKEQTELLSLAAKLHTSFWEHPILKHPTVCSGKPDTCTLFFQGWFEGAVVDPETCPRYRVECITKLGFDPFPKPAQRVMNKVMTTHSVKLLAHFQKILDSRPFTMCHGDMRSDNLFQRKDKTGYRVIDWQTYSASPPAVEMHQLLGASMGKLEDYAQLPTIMRAYLAELHSLCPAARAYTFEMLWEDFRCVSYSYPPAVPSHVACKDC
jgi:thiamine kinase-like enzyme